MTLFTCPPACEEYSEAIAEARKAMERHQQGLNNADNGMLASSLHFPHYRLSNGVMKKWSTIEEYFEDFYQRAGSEWHHTLWGEINVLAASDDKVHLDIRIDRYRADDSLLTSFHSLWVIARINGVWAAQLRSSFAADPR
ncbi:hypothetical protein ACWJJH_07175 [Endozoicomonadaceae bacterium StTr2]